MRMQSPFPGMDPYLEDRWRDVHSSLILYARDQLQSQIMPRYRARVEERVVLDAGDHAGDGPSYFPDVKIVTVREKAPRQPGENGIALAEPIVVVMDHPSITETFIQIIDPKNNAKVITIIEFLSPSNKRHGADRDAYIAKQAELLSSDISLVEIDLLRAGERTMQYDFRQWPARVRTHYAACTTRASTSPRKAELYGFSLRDRLPAIRIPLRTGDADAVLDLQALLDLAYRNGGYDDTDYRKPPVPPLSAEDETWADELLKAAGKR
jgi:hypothetical protein